MDYVQAISFIIFGFAILLFGGEALVSAAVSMASRFKISPAIIGLTIIAAGTSAPELLTTLMAAFKNTPDIALGNVVGSNIFNILAILGIAPLINPILIKKEIFKFEYPALIVFTLIFWAAVYNLEVSRWEGSLFLILLNLFFFISISRARKSEEAKNFDEDLKTLKNWKWDVGYLIVGVLALVIGAQLALDGSIQLGKMVGLSERVLGITIVSIGTGLPELATSAVAAFKKQNDIAFSNVIGSNLINTFGVTGVAASAIPIKVSPEIAGLDTLLMLGATLVLWPVAFWGKRVLSRKEGLVFLTIYLGYILFLFVRLQ